MAFNTQENSTVQTGEKREARSEKPRASSVEYTVQRLKTIVPSLRLDSVYLLFNMPMKKKQKSAGAASILF